ncbi:MAG: DUF4129 domain-containing protein [Firmicutes bacterium]|nr:DUF4129 domain-containing protein [Bacillota bacterium]
MNWNKSRLFRLTVEVLAFCSYFALYAPWFVLIALYFKKPSFLWLYGRLAGLAVIAWAVAYMLQHRLDRAKGGEHRRTTLSLTVAGLCLAALCVMAPETRAVSSYFYLVMYLFAGVLAWVCGISKAMEPPTNYQLQKQLLAGTLSYAVCFLLASRLAIAPRFNLQVLPVLIFWLPVTMVVTGILRVYELQEAEDDEHLKNWLRPLVTISAACLLGAVCFGLLGPPALRIIHILLKYLWQAVSFLLLIAGCGAAYILYYLFLLLSGLLGNKSFEFNPPSLPELIGQEAMENRKAFFSPAFLQILQWVVLVFAVLLAAWTAYRYLLRLRRFRAAKREREARESFFSQQALRNWSRRQLQGLADSLRERVGALALRRRDRTAVDIYHTMLLLAARRGIVRPPATTAHAFQPSLRQACPGCRQEADNIFHAFVRELYAEEVTGAEEMELLRENLAAIKKNL